MAKKGVAAALDESVGVVEVVGTEEVLEPEAAAAAAACRLAMLL